jgi:hypothetical protein
MGPGEGAQFLSAGASEKRDDDVGVKWSALGGNQERIGLVEGEGLGRSPP